MINSVKFWACLVSFYRRFVFHALAIVDKIVFHWTQIFNRLPLPFFFSIEQQFTAFSGTVRLAKRWISAQLLYDHVTEECIELLVASLFLSPAPFTSPR